MLTYILTLFFLLISSINVSATTKTISGDWEGTLISDRNVTQKIEWNFRLKKNNKIEGDGESIIVNSPYHYSNTGEKYAISLTGKKLQDNKYEIIAQSLRLRSTTNMILILSDDGNTLTGTGQSPNIGNFSVELKRKN